MRLIVFITLLFCVFQAAAQDEMEAHYKAKTAAVLESKKQLAKKASLLENYNVVYHRLQLNLNPNILTPTVSGSVTTYFTPLVNNFQVFAFSLRCEMKVDSVHFRGQTLSATCGSNDIFNVYLPVSVPKNELDSVEIFYHGTPISRPGLTRTLQFSGPIIWTFSEPYYAADWWPCKQTLSDKIDSIDIIVKTPAPYRVASNGILASVDSSGAERIYFWKHRYPVAAYLVAIAVTNYAVFSEYAPLVSGDSIEILNYVYPSSLAVAKSEVPKLKPVMRLYDSLFSGYPFINEKYGHAQFGLGGGMEHQTMSFMTGFNYDLMAHELAHQWFGDKVTCGTWADLWLNEGFATYLTGLAYNYLYPKAAWTGQLNDWINSITAQPHGSVFVPDTTDINRLFDQRLTYKKGAMLLHMLRWKLGDSSFYSAVRDYLTDPFIDYSFARTQDLKKKLEAAYGSNLDEFFADWYYGQGYPRYNINWKQEGSKITVTLDQKPSHSTVSFFEIPVPLQLKKNGKDTIIVIDPKENVKEYIFFIPFQADSLIFDPDRWLLAKSTVVKTSGAGNTKKMLLWPNPVHPVQGKGLTIAAVDIQLDHLEVYDNLGQKLFSYDPEEPFISYELKVDDWAPGIYYLVAGAGDLRISEIFIRF